MKPLISVIVPVYKVEPYLSQCIESILNQTYKNLDIILVDDGSPDNCGKICDAYAAQDARIRVFHIENRGLSGARNYGIQKAMECPSNYIGFVDSDDWLEPAMFDFLLTVAEQHHADVTNCGFYTEYKNKTVKCETADKKYDTSIEIVKALINGAVDIRPWNKLYRKQCFETVKFPQGHVFEDTATLHKIYAGINMAVSTSRPLYHYRIRESAISQTHSMDNLIEFWLAHKGRYDFFAQDQRFNSDRELMNKLLYHCAFAIERTYRFLHVVPQKEREPYLLYLQEIRDFSVQNFTDDIIQGWPAHLRLCVNLARYDTEVVPALFYCMNRVYMWLGRTVLKREYYK